MSIKTRISQIIREIPDDAIKDLDWKKILGHFLLKLKYLVLKYLEKNQHVDSKESLEILIQTIDKEKVSMLQNTQNILTVVNVYQLMNVIEPIILTLSKLNNDEKIEYQSIDGKVTATK